MGHTFVKDVMNKDLLTIPSDNSIKQATTLMDEKNVGCVIVTEDKKPIGILTERDFIKRIASKEKNLTNPISDVMSSPLISISAEETIWEAAESMKKNNIHKMAVKSNDEIVGIVTSTDLVKLCSLGSDSEMRQICDQILLRMQKDQ